MRQSQVSASVFRSFPPRRLQTHRMSPVAAAAAAAHSFWERECRCETARCGADTKQWAQLQWELCLASPASPGLAQPGPAWQTEPGRAHYGSRQGILSRENNRPRRIGINYRLGKFFRFLSAIGRDDMSEIICYILPEIL